MPTINHGQVMMWDGTEQGFVPVDTATGAFGPVISVFGRSGIVVATSGDYSFSQISGSLSLGQITSIGTQTLLGRNSAGTGAVETLSATTARTLLLLNNVTNDAQVKRTEMGVANGVATLDSGGLIPVGQLPPLAITDTFVVASQAAMLALTAQVGDVAVRSDLNRSFILRVADPTVLGNWQELLTPTDAVLSVFGRTGVVVSAIGDYSFSQISGQLDLATQTTGLLPDANLSSNVALKNINNSFSAVQTIKVSDATTNALLDVLTLTHNSSGTGAANLGTALLFNLKSSSTVDRNAGRINVFWSTALDAARTSTMAFQTVDNAGALADRMKLSKSLSYILADETRIGSATNVLGNSSRLYVYGGVNGCNIDVQADGSTPGGDVARIEIEASDYATTFNSVNLSFYGPTALGTILGAASQNLGALQFMGGTKAVIEAAINIPLLLGTNGSERIRITGAGLVNIGANASPTSLFSVGSTSAFQVNGTGNVGVFGTAPATNTGINISRSGLATIGNYGINVALDSAQDADAVLLGARFAAGYTGSGSSFHSAAIGVTGYSSMTGTGRMDFGQGTTGEFFQNGAGHTEQPFGAWNSAVITAGTVGAAIGTYSRVYFTGSATSTLSNFNALFHGQYRQTSSATIPGIAGLQLTQWIKTAGNVTVSYGILADTSIDIGLTPWFIYSTSTSPSLFSGDITGTGLGLGAAPLVNNALRVIKTYNTASLTGYGSYVDVTNTGGGSGGLIGSYVRAVLASGSSNVVEGHGVGSVVNAGVSPIAQEGIDILTSTAGSPSSVYGIFNQHQSQTGSAVNNYYGYLNDAISFGTGSVAFAYGSYNKFRCFSVSGGGGFGTAVAYYTGNWGTTGIVNGYGLYIDSTSVDRASGTKYAIYSLAVAPSLITGNLTISGLLKTGTTPVTLTTAAGRIIVSVVDTSSLTANTILKNNSLGTSIADSNVRDDGTVFSVGASTTILSANYSSGVASFGGINPDGFLCDGGLSYLGDWKGLGNVTYLLADDNAGTVYMSAGGSVLSFRGTALSAGGALNFTTAGNLTLNPTGDIVFNGTGKHIDPATNYDQNIGQLSKKYLTIHAAELWVETLVAQNTIATIGGRILIGPTTVLTTDLSPATTSIIVKHNQMVNGDRVYMEANGQVEFMAITSAPSGSGPYTYTVTRDLDGSGANQWYAGDAVFNTGGVGSGFIDLYSVRGVKSSGQTGPTIVGNIRNSTTYNDWSEHWAIGNLNGLYGYGSNTPGIGLGQYLAGKTHVTIDSTNGYRTFSGLSTVVQQIDSSGNITVGEVAASRPNVLVTSTGLDLRVNTTVRAHIDTNGSAYFGNGNFAISTGGVLTIGSWTVNSTTMTGTNLTLDSAGNIRAGATAVLAGNGFFLDGSGTPVARIGTVSAGALVKGLYWDGSNLQIIGTNFSLSAAGNITATGGTVGGWTLGATTLTGTNLVLDSAGNIRAGATAILTTNGWMFDYNAGTPTARVGTVSAGALVKGYYWDGSNLQIIGTNFSLSAAGNISATGGTVGGWTLASTTLTGTNLVLDSAGNIRAGATAILTTNGWMFEYNGGTPRARVGTVSAGALVKGYYWDGSDLQIIGTNFSLSAAGNITATGGTVGGWTLASTTLTGTNLVLDSAGIVRAGATAILTTNGWFFDYNGGTPRFRVGTVSAGALTKGLYWDGSNLQIIGTNTTLDASGNLTVNSGLIGGWSITSTDIRNSAATVILRGAGNLAFGAAGTIPTSASAGTGLFLDSTGLYGLSGGTVQAKFDASTGKITAGVGAVTLDVNGIFISPGTSTINKLSWSTDIFIHAVTTVVGALIVNAQGSTTSTMGSISLKAGNSNYAQKAQLNVVGEGTGTGGSAYIEMFGTNFFGLILGGAGLPNAMLDLRGNGTITGRLGIGQAADSSAALAVTGQYFSTKFSAGNTSTALTIDWNNSNVQSCTATGNVTFTFSNPKNGGRYLIVITQDATGSRTYTWPAAVKWVGGTAPVGSGANKVDVIAFVYDGTNYFGSASLNF